MRRDRNPLQCCYTLFHGLGDAVSKFIILPEIGGVRPFLIWLDPALIMKGRPRVMSTI